MPDQLIAGLDVGGTKCAVLIGDKTGRILHRRQFPSQAALGFEHMFSRLSAELDDVLASFPAVARLSVSIGGPLDTEQGVIYSPPNLPGWDAIPLKSLLEERYQKPCFVEHDATACAIAEYLFGAGRGKNSLVFLTFGTGMGAGFMFNGKPYHGSRGHVSDIGHIRVAPTGPDCYGKPGCWESFASGAGLSKLAAFRYPHRWPEGEVSAESIAELARGGDPGAKELVRECGEKLGQGLALLLDILFPEVVILGSLAIRLGSLVLDPAREIIRHECMPDALELCRITTPELGERLQDIASLSAVLYRGQQV
jgi:glucokinase